MASVRFAALSRETTASASGSHIVVKTDRHLFRVLDGAREVVQADIGVSVTGLAGPDSDETGRQPGLVYIAIDMPGMSFCKELHLPGNRAMVRKLAAEAVLELILEFA